MIRRVAIGLTLLAALVVVLGAGAYAVGGYRVQGRSMEPTLADGRLVFANPLDRTPVRSDLVVYSPDGGPVTVKRVIALPGDEVRIDPAVGVQLHASGTGGWQTVRPGTDERACCAADGRTSAGVEAATVPAGAVFVLGDNPSVSIDSRTQGFIPLAQIRATVIQP